ncbi:Ocs element-binding factor 1 [Cucumis melo var. makuwa]|uniref:BZIP transcription factor 2-like n=2 Tax=Cucumis melo TaxID=3656 RepID=A0A9I9CSG0_CUCME|nr:bZIP transcription factor 2-like [Cucumis melo]KAA0036398.1 Ocs element-binding factor 1 [Cucumis melo var. makuwa]TYK12794.1 Ocs element-binding factor 1 [Cucumis melo var. makuwa]
MLSASPTGSPYESMLENPFPAASTPWECHDYHNHGFLPGFFQMPEQPELLDVLQSPNPVISSSSSENRDEPEALDPGPCEPDRKVEVVDERKRRRMESNRESARRSRLRKQKHLENLRNLVNKLKVENRELSNRLRFTIYEVNRVRTENDHLQTEHTILRRKLMCSRQLLIFRQYQRQLGYNAFEKPPTISQSQSQYILNNNNNNLINC